MRQWVLDYFDCRNIQLINVKKDRHGDEIYSGKIICDNKTFFIRRRIPIFIEKEFSQYIKIKGLYEAIPPTYWKASGNDWIRHMRLEHLRMLTDAINSVNSSNALSILILGCGWGWEVWALRLIMNKLLKRKKYRVIGIDLAYRPLKKAKKIAFVLNEENADFIVSAAEKLPFKRGMFDIVIGLFGVLDHSRFYPILFREVSRVIKSRGLFVFTVLNKFALDWFLKIVTSPRLFLKTIKKAGEPFTRVTIPLKKGGAVRIPTHYYQINEILRFLKSNHFRIVKKYGIFSILHMNFKRHRFEKHHEVLSRIERKLFTVFPFNLLGRYLGILAIKI